jgi:hypothetical protein
LIRHHAGSSINKTCLASIQFPKNSFADRLRPGKLLGIRPSAAERGMNIAAIKKPGGDPPGSSESWMSKTPVTRF